MYNNQINDDNDTIIANNNKQYMSQNQQTMRELGRLRAVMNKKVEVVLVVLESGQPKEASGPHSNDISRYYNNRGDVITK